jgi:hypothetical protein
MATKLIIKLISSTGELLNVVTCFAGQVSVLRASSLNEVRPYQRALFGTSGPERFAISVDTQEYVPSEHTLIGFGETPPYGSLTAEEYLAQVGALEGAVAGALLTLGLQDSAHTPCTALSADHERRLRLLAATYTPGRILILNEPFEPIASGWRERCAELLLAFARNSGGIVVVTQTSFRPESWIDNDAVARIQVGQNSQRTVGFRARSSTTTKLMQQLRTLLGSESEMKQLLQHGDEAPGSAAALSALSGAVVATAAGATRPAAATTSATPHGVASWLGVKGALVAVAGAGVLSAGVIYATLLRPHFSGSGATPQASSAAATQSGSAQVALSQAATSAALPAATDVSARDGDVAASAPQTSTGGAETAPAANPAAAVVTTAMLLDSYPAQIKAALLATVHGSIEMGASGERGVEAGIRVALPGSATEHSVAPAGRKTGNLFQLLEQASSNETARGALGGGPGGSSASPYSSASNPSEISDESLEARREEIRRKFMESLGQSSMNR